MPVNRRRFIQLSTLSAANIGLLALARKTGFARDTAPLHAAQHYRNFLSPAQPYQPGCFWWWFNGLVSREGITRDLEAFREKGMGEVLLINTAGGLGGAQMPQGAPFLSDEWRALYRHALQEAARLGITVGVNFSSGWCMGGPWITPEHAGRWFLQSKLALTGPQRFSGQLPLPGNRDGYDHVFNPPGFKSYIDLPLEQLDYRDSAIVAFRVADEESARLDDARKKLLPAKTNRKDASNFIKSKDVMGPVLEPWQPQAGDQPIAVEDVIDLTGKVNADGYLEWEVPAGHWIILRTGHRMTGSKLMIAQPEANGLSVDWLSSQAVDLQFAHLGKYIIGDAGPLKGTTLQYLGDDSFEDGFPNWTQRILEHFEHYRRYDPRPYLPVLHGYIAGSAALSDRFLHDYRKTVADCMADEHYGHFAKRCHEQGLQVRNESAGPSRSGTMCMDGLKNLGRSDRPTGEFWLGLRHDEPGGLDEKQSYGITRLEGGQNKVTKMVASAAHLYGKQTASAEAFTSFRHWLDYPGNMKQAADRAFCEGINHFLIHSTTCTRPEDGKPGYEYGAGTHFNPNVTWWSQCGPFLAYLGRCQYLLQQGLFVADVLYYNGDVAPNIVAPKHTDPALGKGYDYDVCNEEILLTRLSVKNGRIVLPDGMSYRVLVLPDDKRMPVPVIRKISELVKAGATVIGPQPEQDPGLHNYPHCDAEVRQIAAAVWRSKRVHTKRSIREVLQQQGVQPDFVYDSPDAFIDFIHRRDGDTDIYFVANRNNRPEKVEAVFRVRNKQPELWDPVSGEKRLLAAGAAANGGTAVSLSFAPFQSMFIIFSGALQKRTGVNFPAVSDLQEISGSWELRFDPAWGGPASVVFPTLTDWTQRPEAGIRYYSGAAHYIKQFDMDTMPGADATVFLDLGIVKNIASVKLNGQDLGIVWTAPWRVNITKAARGKNNLLEVEVINLWPNRLIHDATLPAGERLTHTNIVLKKDAALLPSGLLGPVKITVEETRGND
ncbi:glycosyl hydrolase [Chitinophaga japonensis]|uniref:Alpha-L-rhamnosidase-like protein n=1 Tax=Chitinophaga japonensis TaxID=104662 RepID=A0A562T5L2_CHIJA|nr:glycosyl hydrolase [Chitinophaga japonensis]TWI88290.1 alpha-L-rhamnosidase-like protein [Chitinophaga japonensis]